MLSASLNETLIPLPPAYILYPLSMVYLMQCSKLSVFRTSTSELNLRRLLLKYLIGKVQYLETATAHFHLLPMFAI